MRIERTKNATRNIVFGLFLKAYQIILPFIVRSVMIRFMGVEYLGLNGLFVSILQVLNLTELGVGMAMVYSMYKPIAEDDEKCICSLMNLYRLYYRIIGIIIAVGGMSLFPFVPRLVKSDLPADTNIYVLYIINLAATVLTYWLFAYRNCLLVAHQRVDVQSKISLIVNTLLYIVQVIIIVLTKNYYLFQIINNITTALITKRMYPHYAPQGKLPREKVNEINHRIKDLFTAKLGSVIVNSADTIVISAFLGLTALAVYQNYYFILTSVIGVVAIIFVSCTAGIGNSLIVESKSKNYNDLKVLTFLVSWIAIFGSSCFLCLFQPFIVIWIGEDYLLPMTVVICLSLYFYFYEINSLLNVYKDAAGIWHEDRFRPLITALANLLLNLISVNYWGIYGVVLSTVISTVFVGMPWLLHNLFSLLFDKTHLRSYIKQLFVYFAAAVIISMCTYLVCSLICSVPWFTLIMRVILCFFIPNIMFICIFRKKDELVELASLVERVTNGNVRVTKVVQRIRGDA